MSRQTKSLLAAIVGLLVGLGTFAGVVLALRDVGDGDERPAFTDTGIAETGETAALPPIETTPVEPTRTIEVGGLPYAVAVGEGGVWVARDGRRLIRIDPAAGEIVARIGAGDELGSDRACGVAVGAGAVWVTTQSGDLARVSPRTNRLARMIDLDGAACVAVGAGGVWVTEPDLDVVTRIDPQTNEPVAEIPLEGSPLGIDTGFGGVWVASPDSSVVSRIDRRENAIVETIEVPGLPEYVAAGAGGVWVTADDGAIRRIDPSSGSLDELTVTVAEEGRTTLTVGAGSVWAAGIGTLDADASVLRIDPSTGEPAGEPVPGGPTPLGMAYGAGALWVSNVEDGTVTSYTPPPGGA